MGPRLRSARDDLGVFAVRTLFGVARAIPLGALRRFGRVLGSTALAFSRRERRRALRHIELAFPEQAPKWQRTLLRRCAMHLGELLGEVGWLWSAPPEKILAHSQIIGIEHLTGAIDANGGALLVTGHCGNWEWLNLALGASHVPMTVVAREVFDPRLDAIVQHLRGRFGAETALRGTNAGGRMMRGLRQGRVVGLLIDQDIDVPGAFVDYFGRPAWTATGAATLAIRTGRPVVCGFAARLPDGTMQLEFDPPLRPTAGEEPNTAAARLTAALTQRIEHQVRAHPEQWVWMHKRWKHQPSSDDLVWSPDGPHTRDTEVCQRSV
jgi:KDO2-lipid IV(A) lauroyltransferase